MSSNFVKLNNTQLNTKISFMENYGADKNPSDSSIVDPNANIVMKNIATLEAELNKDYNIQVNREILKRSIDEFFGKDLSDNYISDLKNHIIYTHDETTIKPYTYSSQETILVKYNNRLFNVAFEDLYDMLSEPTFPLLHNKYVECKFPRNLYVYDKLNFVQVCRIVKKRRTRNLVCVQTKNGENIIVTDNHPLIVSEQQNETKIAIDSSGEKQFRKKLELQTEIRDEIDGFKLDGDFGYFVGLFISAGYFVKGKIFDEIVIASNSKLLEVAKNFLKSSTNVDSEILEIELGYGIQFNVVKNKKLTEFFKKEFGFTPSDFHSLPQHIFEYPDTFKMGVLLGIFTGNGIVGVNVKKIKSYNRKFISQLSYLFQYFEFQFKMKSNIDTDKIPSFSITLCSEKYETDAWDDIKKISPVKNQSFLLKNEFIYDITTNSGTFILNNLWVHNCASISMYPFLLNGMKTLGGESGPPKHINSFCGSFINLVYAMTSQFAGACLYQAQKLIISKGGLKYSISIKDFVEKFDLNMNFDNSGEVWDFAKVDGYSVFENGKYVDIKKVYRRKYQDKIYKITTLDGKVLLVTKDHIFKVLENNIIVQKKAMELTKNDTVFRGDTTKKLYDINKEHSDYEAGQFVGITLNKENLDEDREMIKEDFCQKFIEKNFNGGSKEDRINLFLETYIVNGSLELSDKLSLEFLVGFLDGIFIGSGIIELNKVKISSKRFSIIETIREILEILNINVLTIFRDKNGIFEIYVAEDFFYSMSLFSNFCLPSTIKNPLDLIKKIEIFENDHPFVYEIETESNWYSCSDIITHNCATVEFLMYFDYFARIDYGPDYLYTNTKEIEQHLQHIVYSLNQPTGFRNYQATFWNISIYDREYFKAMFEHFCFPDYTKPEYASVSNLQKFFMKWFNKEREKVLLTFPVITAACLNDGEKLIDSDFEDFISQELAEGNSFFIFNSDNPQSLSSCCRLKLAIEDSINDFSYSLGAGGVATGSINVITLNCNRFIQNCVNRNLDWKIELKTQINKIQKYQISYRKIIQKFLDAGLFPVYDAGFITLDKQFLTIGINGLVEAAEFLGLEISVNDEYRNFVETFFSIINTSNKEMSKETGFKFNTELIPGESVSSKFSKWDKNDKYLEIKTEDGEIIFLKEKSKVRLTDGKITEIGKLKEGDDIDLSSLVEL